MDLDETKWFETCAWIHGSYAGKDKVLFCYKYYDWKPFDSIALWMYSLTKGVLSAGFKVSDDEYDGSSCTKNFLENLKKEVDGRHMTT